MHHVNAITISGGNSINGADSISDSIRSSDEDLGNQSRNALNHTLQQYFRPFNCSARHADKDQGLDMQTDKGLDNYYDNPPVWSRDELEALPYTISDLLDMLIEVVGTYMLLSYLS